jgi:NADH-quinone oxidoreductase subunit M
MILLWLILVPIIGGILAWFVGRWNGLASRYIALASALADFAIALFLWVSLPVMSPPGNMLIDYRMSWIPQVGIGFHLALDGLSLLLIMLTTVIGIVAVMCSWREIDRRVGAFHLAMMILIAAISECFCHSTCSCFTSSGNRCSFRCIS